MALQGMIPIRIGMSKRFEVISGLTKNSILRNTKAKCDIQLVYDPQERGCTQFSNVRYMLNEAIYLDCDMIVLSDIEELWEYRREGKFVCMENGQTEVSIPWCEHKCTNKREEHLLPKACIIPPEWNVYDCDYYEKPLPENIKLLHFTSLDHQPWFHENPCKQAVDIYRQYI